MCAPFIYGKDSNIDTIACQLNCWTAVSAAGMCSCVCMRVCERVRVCAWVFIRPFFLPARERALSLFAHLHFRLGLCASMLPVAVYTFRFCSLCLNFDIFLPSNFPSFTKIALPIPIIFLLLLISCACVCALFCQHFILFGCSFLISVFYTAQCVLCAIFIFLNDPIFKKHKICGECAAEES